jgi:hypothetical protein
LSLAGVGGVLAALCALAAALVFAIKGDFTPDRVQGALLAGLKADVVEGVRWAWRRPLLRDIMVLDAISNIVFFATFSVSASNDRVVLEVDSSGEGVVLFGAPLLHGKFIQQIGQIRPKLPKIFCKAPFQ